MSKPCTFVSAPLVMLVLRLGMLPCPWVLPVDRRLGEDAVRGEGDIVVVLCIVLVLLCEARLTNMQRGRVGKANIMKGRCG